MWQSFAAIGRGSSEIWRRKKETLEVHGRARREAARRRNTECKNNLDSRNSSHMNGSWQMTPKGYPRTTWRMVLA